LTISLAVSSWETCRFLISSKAICSESSQGASKPGFVLETLG
jgi:hypothetical protein